jgi:hypothetical protein
MAARNEMATKLKEFRNFLSHKTEPNTEVRLIASMNPNSQKFKEFENFFSEETEPSDEIRFLVRKDNKVSQKTDKIISKKDFERYFKLKEKLSTLREEYDEDNQELIEEVQELEKNLLPPEIELEDDLLRELQRLKKINLKEKQPELPKRE